MPKKSTVAKPPLTPIAKPGATASPATGTASDCAQFRRLLELSSDWYWEQDQHYRFIDTGASTEMQVRNGWEVRVGSTRWDNPSNDLTPEQWAAHRACSTRASRSGISNTAA